MRVKPKPGLVVNDPHSGMPLPPEGRDVPESPYWSRRRACGDVLPVTANDEPDSEEES